MKRVKFLVLQRLFAELSFEQANFIFSAGAFPVCSALDVRW
jgi:hypothetical protein